MPASCTGSCTAGLRVDTGLYKVVYFAFGFEAINSAADRQVVMERVLNWLKPLQPSLYLPLVLAQPAAAGTFWADRYQLRPGECTTLHWSVANVQAVFLDDVPVTGQGTRVVCPTVATAYVLRVIRASVTVDYRLMITVVDGD